MRLGAENMEDLCEEISAAREMFVLNLNKK